MVLSLGIARPLPLEELPFI
jgi:hypothetical protein